MRGVGFFDQMIYNWIEARVMKLRGLSSAHSGINQEQAAIIDKFVKGLIKAPLKNS